MKTFKVNDKIYCHRIVGQLIIKHVVDKNNQLTSSLTEDKIKYLICLDIEGKTRQVNVSEAITEGEI